MANLFPIIFSINKAAILALVLVVGVILFQIYEMFRHGKKTNKPAVPEFRGPKVSGFSPGITMFFIIALVVGIIVIGTLYFFEWHF